MIYKAKKSYFDLKDSENFNAFDSPAKHNRLINGESVEITSVPKSLEKYLESAEPKKVKKEDK